MNHSSLAQFQEQRQHELLPCLNQLPVLYLAENHKFTIKMDGEAGYDYIWSQYPGQRKENLKSAGSLI